MQIDAGVRASEQPPGRRREDRLEGRREWVTSRGWRQRVCESVSSRRCSVVLLCLVPIHHLSGISQGVMRNVHSCENKKDEGENGKSQLRQMRTSPQCSRVSRFPVQRGNLENKSDSSNETVSYRGVNMKAISPVRSFRKSSANVTEHSLGISRSKTPVDDPLSLLYNMNDCYSKLKELVPSIPQNKNVSKMEILQHVIDYILDLQIALDSNSAITSLHHPRAGQGTSRTPLTTLNTDISILSLQTPEFQSDLITEDSRTLYR
ncbi:hypothetical protein G5714_017185 [Onychostoma macrolepis]|uniref:DNA-binding protein inhibitor ID-4 n=1 Tax=Onychostoma macrolepis TaxID=369639 RepID=A0A7J6C712_9TELE|nr:hypothetical protein G5714_017185 [Onychostoma macrolepis]